MPPNRVVRDSAPYMRSMPLFGLLADIDLLELESAARQTRFANGKMLFIQDDPSDTVFKMIAGVAKLDRVLPDGRRHVQGFALPGYFLGISMSPRRNYGAQALGSVVALRFELTAFKQFVFERPHLLRQLFNLAGREIDAAHELTVTLGRRSAEDRLLWFFAEMRERWKLINGQSDRIPLPMTRTDIADHLGLTIETISRTITKLAHDKVISVEQGAVRIVNHRRFAGLDRPMRPPLAGIKTSIATY